MGRIHEEGGFWCLARINLFDHLDDAQLDELHHWVKTIRYRKGEIIFLPGDPSDFVYFLHSGRVKLVYLDDSGKRLTLGICKPGELFGEMALVGERQRRLIAEALEDVELCIVASRDLLSFASAHPDLALRLTRAVGQRMIALENRLEDLVFKDVPTRLARLLVRLAEEYGEAHEEGTLLNVRLTHRDLADLIGSTRETTTTTLSQFNEQGLIGKANGRLVVRDPQQLRELAQLYE